jgi:hypothetical protein
MFEIVRVDLFASRLLPMLTQRPTGKLLVEARAGRGAQSAAPAINANALFIASLSLISA